VATAGRGQWARLGACRSNCLPCLSLRPRFWRLRPRFLGGGAGVGCPLGWGVGGRGRGWGEQEGEFLLWTSCVFGSGQRFTVNGRKVGRRQSRISSCLYPILPSPNYNAKHEQDYHTTLTHFTPLYGTCIIAGQLHAAYSSLSLPKHSAAPRSPGSPRFGNLGNLFRFSAFYASIFSPRCDLVLGWRSRKVPHE